MLHGHSEWQLTQLDLQIPGVDAVSVERAGRNGIG